MTGEAIELEPDSHIAQYRVISKLGQGGMGAVYLAEHTLLGRKAALKILHPSLTQREDIVERFFNEARAATSIADPGIVQIFDFGYQDELAYIVMELLDGESLDARLKRLDKLPVADALRLARQMSLSLYAAHRQGVVHRDLKPENVFVVPDAEASGGERTKILDFGIAKLTDAEQNHKRTQTGMMMGTPVYMSPEQCRGSGTLDHRSDIYSLGCLLFHLLAGRPPFDHENAGELIAAHLKEPAPPPSQFVPVSPAVDAIIGRCLEKAPEQRYESMRELASALDAAMRGVSGGVDLARMTPLPTMTSVPAVTVPPEPSAAATPGGSRSAPRARSRSLRSSSSWRSRAEKNPHRHRPCHCRRHRRRLRRRHRRRHRRRLYSPRSRSRCHHPHRSHRRSQNHRRRSLLPYTRSYVIGHRRPDRRRRLRRNRRCRNHRRRHLRPSSIRIAIADTFCRVTAPAFEPGVMLGKYKLIAPIGRGGMGGVWEVEDAEGHRFALKSPASGLNPAAEATKRFAREANAVRLLDHPNLVAAVEVFVEHESLFLVMERVVGHTLTKALAKGHCRRAARS